MPLTITQTPMGGNADQRFVITDGVTTWVVTRSNLIDDLLNFIKGLYAAGVPPGGPAGGDLFGTYPNPSVGLAHANDLSLSANFDLRRLYEIGGGDTLDWNNGDLKDSANVTAANWMGRVLNDNAGSNSVDWDSRQLTNNLGGVTADWDALTLSDGAIPTINWGSRILSDSSGIDSVAWNTRVLVDNGNTSSLDWDGRALVGAWRLGATGGLPYILNVNTGTFSPNALTVSRIWIFPDITGTVLLTGSTIVAGAVVLTTQSNRCQAYSGAGNTWTLPDLATAAASVKEFFIKNRGSGNLVVQRAGADNLYTTASVTSVTLTPGQAAIFIADSSFWNVE